MVATCKFFCLEDFSSYYEEVWSGLCDSRWHLSRKAHYSLSSASMKDSYRTQHNKLRIPEGKYTGGHHILFGKGREKGVGAWFGLSHSPDAQLKSVKYKGEEYSSIELHVCLQNIHHDVMSILTQPVSIRVHSLPHSDPTQDTLLHTVNVKTIAKNGAHHKHTGDGIRLYAFDFVVLSVTVYGPEDVCSEPDFITMLQHIHVTYTTHTHIHTNQTHTHRVTLKPVEEGEVWNHYQVLPSGVVLLRTE
ncbi:hypothetical protein EON63_09775 [archaeon]|nr:MAG: hypothetical protein EON63_09775 [archaeon]